MCEWSNGEPVNNIDLQSCLVVEKIVNTGSLQASLTAPLSCYLAIMGEIGNVENVTLWMDSTALDCKMNKRKTITTTLRSTEEAFSHTR